MATRTRHRHYLTSSKETTVTQNPPTDLELDEIATRAAHLYEYVNATDDAAQPDFDQLTGTDVPALLAEIRRQRARVAELEGPAVDARAALAALCYDLEDPGTAALGALYLLQRATVGVEAPRDDAALALARHDAQVIRKAAETLEATERDDYAVNLLHLLADGTERAAASASAVAVSGGDQQ